MTKISKENAEAQLQLLLDYYLIDVEDVQKSDEFYKRKDDLEEAKKTSCDRLLKYIQHGLIEITTENGLTVTQRLRTPIGEMDRITYGIISGKDQREMRHAKDDNDHVGKIFCLMGALGKVPGGANTIAKMSGPDIGALQCLGMIFLTV